MRKVIANSKESREKILRAVDLIADPVCSTLSPLGTNVLYEDSNGQLYVTNDGVTIARQISSEDPIENAVIEVIKHASLKTNSSAGDGTSTTIMLTRSLIKDGLKLIEEGMNPMKLKEHLTYFKEALVSNLKPTLITNDEELKSIASISANNDDSIAEHIVDVVKVAGQTGLVFIEPSKTGETIIEKDSGYVLNQGMLDKSMAQEGGFTASYENVPMLITSKRIYYEEEALSIIQTALELGHKNLVIVARDFIGKSLNVFLGNHSRGIINLLLVKDPSATETDDSSLVDLATYVGGELITEKQGKLVGSLTEESFTTVAKVYSNPARTVIVTANPDSKKLKSRIEKIQTEFDKDETNEDLKRRLASLTTGMVTIKVGGSTPIEVQEKIFRYEDAINATRAAMKDGYLAGGGIALLQAHRDWACPVAMEPMYRRYCESSVRQIAENCGEYPDHVISMIDPKSGVGYNARTGRAEDMIASGIIDPYQVTKMAIENSISVATALLTSKYILVYDKQDDKSKANGGGH